MFDYSEAFGVQGEYNLVRRDTAKNGIIGFLHAITTSLLASLLFTFIFSVLTLLHSYWSSPLFQVRCFTSQ